MIEHAAIQATALGKSRGGRVILDRVTLSIAEGEITAIMGPNGAGKSTLLRCLAGQLRPSAGRVSWFGVERASNPEVRKNIGLVGHESFLYPDLTAEENLLFAAGMCGMRNATRQVARWVEGAGIAPHLHRRTAELSRGLRQRVAVLRALVHAPRILLLDEPFASLDPAGAEWLVSLLIEQRAQGRAQCIVLHDAQTVGRIADRIVRLENGRLHRDENGSEVVVGPISSQTPNEISPRPFGASVSTQDRNGIQQTEFPISPLGRGNG
jgi:heme exporter protein A